MLPQCCLRTVENRGPGQAYRCAERKKQNVKKHMRVYSRAGNPRGGGSAVDGAQTAVRGRIGPTELDGRDSSVESGFFGPRHYQDRCARRGLMVGSFSPLAMRAESSSRATLACARCSVSCGRRNSGAVAGYGASLVGIGSCTGVPSLFSGRGCRAMEYTGVWKELVSLVPQPALVSIADGDTTVSRIERAAGCPRSTLDDRVSLPLAHTIGSTKGVDGRGGSLWRA